MKKFIFSVFSVALIFGFLNGPVQTGATTKSEELVEPANLHYKEVSASRTYATVSSIPSSISYNSNNWSGTLYLVGYSNAGDFYVAIFRGTVSCSGPCQLN